MLLAPYVCFHIFNYVKVTEWPPIGKIAAHSAYDMFHGISLVFSHLCFWCGNLFLIAPFPDLCLLVTFSPFLHYLLVPSTPKVNIGNTRTGYLYFQYCELGTSR